MPDTATPSGAPESVLSSAGLAVIVDLIFDDGLLFIAVRNISDRPAFQVEIRFKPKIMGLGGRKEVSALPLFKKIEFLAPHKEIRTFLDSSADYFRRGEPTRISAQIAYRDEAGRQHQATIQHDLEIYREIGYVRRPRLEPGAPWTEDI